MFRLSTPANKWNDRKKNIIICADALPSECGANVLFANDEWMAGCGVQNNSQHSLLCATHADTPRQHFTHFSAKVGVNFNGILPWIARSLFTVASTGCTYLPINIHVWQMCGEPAFWDRRVWTSVNDRTGTKGWLCLLYVSEWKISVARNETETSTYKSLRICVISVLFVVAVELR